MEWWSSFIKKEKLPSPKIFLEIFVSFIYFISFFKLLVYFFFFSSLVVKLWYPYLALSKDSKKLNVCKLKNVDVLLLFGYSPFHNTNFIKVIFSKILSRLSGAWEVAFEKLILLFISFSPYSCIFSLTIVNIFLVSLFQLS